MKVHIVTLGFDNTERIVRTIDRFFKETDYEGLDIIYHIVDARYPYPSQAANVLNLCQFLWRVALADHYPVPMHLIILDRNYGQTGNYVELKTRFEFEDDDVIVFYDTDVRPDKPSWLKDKIKVLGSPLTAFVSMNCSVTDNAIQHMGALTDINGIKCRPMTFPGGWSTGAWSGKFFRAAPLKVTHEFYGGTEYNIQCAWRALGLQGYMMCDHDDLRDLEGMDACYNEWKHSVIAVEGKQVDFEAYLKERKLIL